MNNIQKIIRNQQIENLTNTSKVLFSPTSNKRIEEMKEKFLISCDIKGKIGEMMLDNLLKQVATKAIEAVKLEKCKGDEFGFKGEGFNFAVDEIEQKAKKFLEDNF